MKTDKPCAVWPFLLCVSIILAYSCFMLLHIPLCLLGKAFKSAWRAAGLVFQTGVKCLIAAQPWLKLERDFKIPKQVFQYDRPLVIISNHRSNLDVFYFLSAIPNIRILAKKKFFNIPFFGIGLRLLRLIPVQNDNYDVYRAALKKVKNIVTTIHDPVLFFPEMTRCEEGTKGLGKFSLAPFQVAFETQAVIIPTLVLGNDLSWPKGFFGGRFRKKNTLKSLKPIESRDFKTARTLQKFVFHEMESALQENWESHYGDA